MRLLQSKDSVSCRPMPADELQTDQKETEESSGCAGKLLAGGLGCYVLMSIALVVGFFGVFASMAWFIHSDVTRSEPYNVAVERATSDEEVHQTLGKPVEVGWMFTSETYSTPDGQKYSLEIPLRGSKQDGLIYVDARRQGGSGWVYDRLEVSRRKPPASHSGEPSGHSRLWHAWVGSKLLRFRQLDPPPSESSNPMWTVP